MADQVTVRDRPKPVGIAVAPVTGDYDETILVVLDNGSVYSYKRDVPVEGGRPRWYWHKMPSVPETAAADREPYNHDITHGTPMGTP